MFFAFLVHFQEISTAQKIVPLGSAVGAGLSMDYCMPGILAMFAVPINWDISPTILVFTSTMITGTASVNKPSCGARNIMRGARDAKNANPTQVRDYTLVMLEAARQIEQLALRQVATQLVADNAEEGSTSKAMDRIMMNYRQQWKSIATE